VVVDLHEGPPEVVGNAIYIYTFITLFSQSVFVNTTSGRNSITIIPKMLSTGIGGRCVDGDWKGERRRQSDCNATGTNNNNSFSKTTSTT
jgi:hypothetical protein